MTCQTVKTQAGARTVRGRLMTRPTAMNEETVARRRALGIPVHGDDEHEWRSDGYCNCGTERKTKPRATYLPPGGRMAGKSNLDTIEGNGGNR